MGDQEMYENLVRKSQQRIKAIEETLTHVANTRVQLRRNAAEVSHTGQLQNFIRDQDCPFHFSSTFSLACFGQVNLLPAAVPLMGTMGARVGGSDAPPVRNRGRPKVLLRLNFEAKFGRGGR